jgi:hypothetical protein
MGMKVIDLQENEKHLYTGSGLRVAQFQDNQLVGLFDPLDQVPETDDEHKDVTAMVHAVLDWVIPKEGEFKIVMASCYQLCDPVYFDPSSETDRAMLYQFLRYPIENHYV